MDLRCTCGAVAWRGAGDAIIEAGDGGRVVIDAGDVWLPGQPWRCSSCQRRPVPASLTQTALDDTVDRWMDSQRE
jgi:hypothetical protein